MIVYKKAKKKKYHTVGGTFLKSNRTILERAKFDTHSINK